ncbi:MAG TPA: alpha-L-fucosidase [Clostridiales bacterium]|nr:alpha-L-fucosidase [Clostridiales bacterium]
MSGSRPSFLILIREGNNIIMKHEATRPTAAQLAWQDMELGMFIHWSPTTYFTESGYDNLATPLKEIDPKMLDTDQWVKVARFMGARYIVIVAKHMEGFCIWQTQTTEYSIQNTPWRDGKGDILKDLSESCRKYGIHLGVYLSPADKHFGARTGGKCETPDKQKEYECMYREQLTELLTRYGQMVEVWFDGSNDMELGDILKQHAPDAMVFQSRYATIRWVGNEEGIATYPAWNAVQKKDAETGVATNRHGTPEGDVWMPLECDARIRAAWFWKPDNETTLKSVDQLMQMYYRSVGNGAVLLLNHTPDRTGLIPEADVQRAAEFGAEIQRRFGYPLKETPGSGESVELVFDRPEVVDHVVIMEEIAFGERIRAYTVEGLLESGEWKVLCRGTAVGHKRIEPFAPARVSKIRLTCTKYTEYPLIRKLAAFCCNAILPETNREISTSSIKIGEWGSEIYYRKGWSRGAELEYDITDLIDDAGQFEIKFIQVYGEHGFEASVSVWIDGLEYPQYVEPGNQDLTYHLFFPGIEKDIRIKATMKGIGGSDCNGEVYLTRVR